MNQEDKDSTASLLYLGTHLKVTAQTSLHLAVVLEDIGGSTEVQDAIEHQLTVASKLFTFLLKKNHILFQFSI